MVGLLGSSAAKADSFDVQTSTVPIKKKTVRHATHQTVYITSVAVTGSHLPLVVARYGNDLRSTSSLVAYSRPQLDQTGQLNIGAQLDQRDPAISSARGVH